MLLLLVVLHLAFQMLSLAGDNFKGYWMDGSRTNQFLASQYVDESSRGYILSKFDRKLVEDVIFKSL